jgi:hypothetical protein
MNLFKKDQSRTEMTLIIGVIVLTIIVIARFFGTEIMDFFFGAGSNIQVVGTDRENELKNPQAGKVKGKPKIDESKLDPSVMGDEEALAQQYYKQQEAQWAKIKAMIIWTFALIIFIVVLGLIGWKTYSIVMEIRSKNIDDIDREEP